jgi:hypothetical protein
MKNRVSFVAWITVLSAGCASASAAETVPVWQKLEAYSQKDKSFVEAHRPQLEKIEKELKALQLKLPLAPAKDKPKLMEQGEKLDGERRALLGELIKHEFEISSDVAQFATERSAEAKAKLAELMGKAQAGPPPPGAETQAAAPPATTALRGAQQKIMDEFEAEIDKRRMALEEELKKMPPDPDEVAREELKARLRKIANEEEEKIRKMPPGPKKQKRDAFDKKVQEERAALMQRLKQTDGGSEKTAGGASKPAVPAKTQAAPAKS